MGIQNDQIQNVVVQIKIFLSIVVVLLLASCSNGSKSNNRSLSEDTPKSNASKAYLTINRLDPLHNLSKPKIAITIDDAEVLNKLEASLDKLPAFPKEIIHCPADLGIQYELQFHQSYEIRKVLVRATGCQQVTMDSKTYWALEPKGNGFLPLLEATLGLSDEEFVGRK